VGCSHTIDISPPFENLPIENSKKINKNVGYYISKADLTKKVITPGGGGDDVEYTPYKDIESALYKILLNVYKDAYKLNAASDKNEINKNKISYVFIPKLVTNSSSGSFLTWPPTDFSVELTTTALNKNGKKIWIGKVTGKGHAEYDEFITDFSLSARRASEAVLKKLQKQIQSSRKLR
jgi:hypothetical protein